MKTLNIAVVGAGLGGLSAAARLAAAGHRVEVYDRQSFPGGKAGTNRLEGFRFDTGPSLVTMLDVFRQLFDECGRSIDEFIELVPLDEICRYVFDDGTKMTSFADRAKFGAEVEANTGDTAGDLRRFLDYSARIYRITADLFLWKSLHEARTYLNPGALRSILSFGRIDAFRTMHDAVRSYFSDPKMVQFFDRYATYNGSNPYRTPGTLNIIPHVEYDIGAAAVRGGIFVIPTALATLARACGATINYGAEVSRITYDDASRRINGVTVDGESIEYDTVISNADVDHTYRVLLRDRTAPLLKRYRSLEPSSSGLVFYFGVKEPYPELGLHNIFFSSDYRREFDDIFERGMCPEDPTVYINITSKITPEDAPTGCENWFVLINAPHDAGQDWHEEAKRSRERVISRISRSLGRPVDVGASIVCEEVMTPKDIEARTGSRFGSLYGISSNTRLAAFLRHPNRSRRYPGLYFCGGSAHPGGGMPLVMLSGKITSDIIRRRNERWKP